MIAELSRLTGPSCYYTACEPAATFDLFLLASGDVFDGLAFQIERLQSALVGFLLARLGFALSNHSVSFLPWQKIVENIHRSRREIHKTAL